MGRTDFSATVENYLKQIYGLSREGGGGPVGMGEVARAMQVVPGTATTMIKSLADAGLAKYQPRVGVRLTPKGERVAVQVLRRHRLVEYFLVETLGMDWSEIHEEAERLEHAISDRVLDRIDAFLGHPKTDPHGDVIPAADGSWEPRTLLPLAEAPPRRPLTIAQVTDQDAAFLRFADEMQLKPGNRVEVIDRSGQADCLQVQVAERNTPISLGTTAAGKILVEARGRTELND